MKLVTSAYSKNFSNGRKGADVVVAGVYSKISGFLGEKYRATQFLTSENSCYNCYKCFFNSIRIRIVKVSTVVTRLFKLPEFVTSL